MQKLQNKYFKNKLDWFPTSVSQAKFTGSSFICTNSSVFMNNKYFFPQIIGMRLYIFCYPKKKFKKIYFVKILS